MSTLKPSVRGILVLGACVVACLTLGGCTPGEQAADLVLLGGKIVTLDESSPEVQALAARDGRIVALGSDDEIRELIGPDTRTLELGGKLAIPGFIEGHGHFTGFGRSLMTVDLKDARSWEEVIARTAEAARTTEPGHWILGFGWHQSKWDNPPEPAVEGYPVHQALSAAVPDHPVLLKHAAGSHAAMVNALAMERSGIDASTPDPAGGKILRDRRGQPTGVLRETAAQLVLDAQAQWEASLAAGDLAALRRREIELASEECLARGVTSFQDAGSDFDTVDRLREAAEAGTLGPRLWVMLRVPNSELRQRAADYRVIGAADDHLTVRAIKRSIDGALGSHGAWLLEPYEDLPGDSGLNTIPLDDLGETAEIARELDMQLCVHAIGDRGNRETLDLFQKVFEAEATVPSARRWRVEHAQHLAVSDIPRFAQLGVIASMQGIHCTSDGPWVPDRLGERRSEEGAYVWRRLLDSGAVVSNGTDVPVEDIDPLENFYATVTRDIGQGRTFYPDQVMTRMEALRSYTIAAAYAAFEEEIKGSLSPGKLADIVVLSKDILTVPAEEILDTDVLHTIVGGRVLYGGDSG